MTKMLIDRSTVEQVLEALEQSETTVPYEGFGMARRDAERKHHAAITSLKAALAEPQEPGCRDDGMPTSAEERHLRRLLALRATMPHAYYDDGEAQGIEHGISIDFMREPVAHIDAKLRALNVARAIAKQSEPVQEAVATMTVREDMGADFKFSRPHTLQPGQQFYLCATPPQRPAEPGQEPESQKENNT